MAGVDQNRLADFEVFLRHGGATGRTLSESTIATYLRVARKIVVTRPPQKILKAGLSTTTKAKYLAVLRQWARFTGNVPLDVLLRPGPELAALMNLRASRLPEKIEAFSDNEIERFMRVVEEFRGENPLWVWPCVHLHVYLALRVGVDLAGLRRDAVRRALRTKQLAVMGKGQKVDFLPAGFVSEEIEELVAISGWKTVADLISPDSREREELRHREAAYGKYRKALLYLGEQAGIDAGKTHRFRHWGITNFIKKVAQGDLKRAQRFARHASLETTLRYYKTVELAEDDEALGELRLEF